MKPQANTTASKRIIATISLFLLLSSVTPLHAQERQWRSGEDLYNKVCGYCHKPEVGVGTVIQGRGLPPEYLTIIVRNGFNAMPAFPASYVDDASIVELAKYLANLPAIPPAPAGATP